VLSFLGPGDLQELSDHGAIAGSPKVLDLFRSNRVLKEGRLHWSAPASSTAKTSLRVFTETPLSVQMVR